MRRGGLTRIAQEATLLGTVIVLALVIWFVITDAQNREFEQPLGFSLPVSVINLPSNLAVAGEALPVSLTVVGTRSALDAVSPDDFSATIDAQGRAAGQYSLPVRAESLVEDVRVRAVQPETAVLTLQELIRREVPVRVEAANPPPLGFSVGQPSVAPERATVTGIAADVELVEAVVARLDLAGATVSLEGDVLLEPRTSGGAAVARVTVEPRFARVAAPITQEVFRRAVAVRANVQGAPRAGYRVVEITVEPSTVELFVPLGAATQDSVWTELIDVEDRRTSVRRLVPLELGDAAPAGATEALVTVQIEQIESTVRLTAAVRVEGVAEGLEAVLVNPEAVQVELRGFAEDVAQFVGPPEDAVADVSGLGTGRHTVELSLDPAAAASDGLTVTGLLPRLVTVVLMRQQPPDDGEEAESDDE